MLRVQGLGLVPPNSPDPAATQRHDAVRVAARGSDEQLATPTSRDYHLPRDSLTDSLGWGHLMHLKTSDLPPMELGFAGYTCNWGTHFCGLYESDAERDAIMYGFLGEGVRRGELLICCPDAQRYAGAFDNVQAGCPECAPDRSSLRLLHSHELYHPQGYFSPQDMFRAHESIWRENLAAGARNVRGTAEMGWALERIPGVEQLMAYESLLNYFIWGKSWISICLYDINRFPGSIVMRVLQTHPFVITGGGVYENPYFVHPDKWLARNAPGLLQLAGTTPCSSPTRSS